MSICMLVAGDFCPHDRGLKSVNEGHFDIIDPSIVQRIKAADLSVVNLECPIVEDDCMPIFKQGPNLCASEAAIDLIKLSGFNVVTLANNHFRDYGDGGVKHTISVLDKQSIKHVGGGNNIREANRPLILEIREKRIAIVNFCENEFSIADSQRGGASPLNHVDIFNQITEAKKESDCVIVISHGGHEHYQLPSPRMIQLFRWLVDIGANAVVNHHQHCYSGYEIYNGSPIFYGLGNFFFDWDGQRGCPWNYGYFVELSLGECIDFDIHPYKQCDTELSVKMLNEEEKSQFDIKLAKLNNIIGDSVSLEEEYEEYCRSRYSELNLVLSPYTGRYTTALCRRGVLPAFNTPARLVKILNNVDCEARRDVLLHFLKDSIQ